MTDVTKWQDLTRGGTQLREKNLGHTQNDTK